MEQKFENITKRLKELSFYGERLPINETIGSDYLCIGEIPNYFPWGKPHSENKIYIMVDPNITMKGGKEIHNVIYAENNDGSGLKTDEIPSINKNNAIIYPQYQDTELGEIFLGKKKENSEIELKHKAFLSKLFRMNGKVILHHNSSVKITDGVIKKGTPNGYSNNTDMGIYFWGSRNAGNDPSNGGLYSYYCIIDEKDLYDKETNPERLSLSQAMKKYKYVGQYWNDGQAVVVTTEQATPIWTILDKANGKWYDSKWQEINMTF